MTRSLIISVNGLWDHLPVVCRCRHQFTVELGDDVVVRVAPQGLHHAWFARCPQCHRNVPLVWPDERHQTGVTLSQNPNLCGIRPLGVSTPPCG